MEMTNEMGEHVRANGSRVSVSFRVNVAASEQSRGHSVELQPHTWLRHGVREETVLFHIQG